MQGVVSLQCAAMLSKKCAEPLESFYIPGRKICLFFRASGLNYYWPFATIARSWNAWC
jgi:hypothetical protein